MVLNKKKNDKYLKRLDLRTVFLLTKTFPQLTQKIDFEPKKFQSI